jgi:hypothetical protein
VITPIEAHHAWLDIYFGAGFLVLAVIEYLTGWTSMIYQGFVSREKDPINYWAGVTIMAGVGVVAIGLGVSKLL